MLRPETYFGSPLSPLSQLTNSLGYYPCMPYTREIWIKKIRLGVILFVIWLVIVSIIKMARHQLWNQNFASQGPSFRTHWLLLFHAPRKSGDSMLAFKAMTQQWQSESKRRTGAPGARFSRAGVE